MMRCVICFFFFFFFQAEDGIRDGHVTGVQTCALPICGVRASEFWKTVLSLVISPPAGFILAAVVMTLLLVALHRARPVPLNRTFRSEERRVGKECRSRGWPGE